MRIRDATLGAVGVARADQADLRVVVNVVVRDGDETGRVLDVDQAIERRVVIWRSRAVDVPGIQLVVIDPDVVRIRFDADDVAVAGVTRPKFEDDPSRPSTVMSFLPLIDSSCGGLSTDHRCSQGSAPRRRCRCSAERGRRCPSNY